MIREMLQECGPKSLATEHSRQVSASKSFVHHDGNNPTEGRCRRSGQELAYRIVKLGSVPAIYCRNTDYPNIRFHSSVVAVVRNHSCNHAAERLPKSRCISGRRRKRTRFRDCPARADNFRKFSAAMNFAERVGRSESPK